MRLVLQNFGLQKKNLVKVIKIAASMDANSEHENLEIASSWTQ